MCVRDMLTASENGRCRWKIVLEKFKKNLVGVAPHLYLRQGFILTNTEEVNTR